MANKKIPIRGIMKVADIEHFHITAETQEFLKKVAGCTYKDQEFEEDLYSLETIFENIDEAYEGIEEGKEGPVSDAVMEELRQIKKQIEKRGCAYLRIAFS